MHAKSANYKKIKIALGWLPLESIVNFVETFCSEDEVFRLPEIEAKWRTASQKFSKLIATESKVAEGINLRDMHKDSEAVIKEIESQPLFAKNFGKTNYAFRMVELEKVITFPLYVYTNYVQEMTAKLSNSPTERELINLCLEFDENYKDEVSEFRSNPNTYLFSSDKDLRFLGSSTKYTTGGFPTKAIMLFLGFGSPRMNAYSANNKIYLNNGMHRAIALYSKGVRYAPMIIQELDNPNLSFPLRFYDVPRRYALDAPRPPMLKDFFDPDLTMELEVKPTKRAVKVTVVTEETLMPI
jgi:hypothetical protein